MKTQHWTWPVKLRALPWPSQSILQQRWAQYGKGWVSINRTACGSSRDHWLHTTKFRSSW